MKMLFVLLFVVGMGSLASATYELNNNAEFDICLVGDGEFDAFFISLVGGGTFDISLNYDGSLASLTDYTGLDQALTAGIDYYAGVETDVIYFAVFADAVDPENNKPIGDVLCITVVDGTWGTGVNLHNADTLEVVSSAFWIPEPMSLALLGLGGLLVRRRR